jgi:hypothetical protein
MDIYWHDTYLDIDGPTALVLGASVLAGAMLVVLLLSGRSRDR